MLDELRAENVQLPKQFKWAESEREILKRPRHSSRRSRCEVRLDHAASRVVPDQPDVQLARRFDVGYYDAVDRPLSSHRAQRWYRIIHAAVREAFMAVTRWRGNWPAVTTLSRLSHAPCGRWASRAASSKAFTPTTPQSDLMKQTTPNTLARDFTAEKPNRSG